MVVSKWLKTTATVLSVSFASAGVADAQFNNGGNSLAGGGASGDQSEKAYIGRPSGFSVNAEWDGPGLSRLPLTTEEATPIGQSTNDNSGLGEPGISDSDLYENQAVGTHPDQWPYATARVAVTGTPGPGTFTPQIPVTSRPYRFTGKLWMRFGANWFVCTASLIKQGVLITAAHCVHNYGQAAAGIC